jgi:hypothetical protein
VTLCVQSTVCVWSNNIQIQLASSIQVGEREEKETKACIVVFVLYTRRIWTGQQTPGEYPSFFFSIQFNSIQKKKRKEGKKRLASSSHVLTHTEERNRFPFSFFFRLLMEFDSSRTESKADVSHIESKKPTGKVWGNNTNDLMANVFPSLNLICTMF